MAQWNVGRITKELHKLRSYDDREAMNLATWLWEEACGYSQNKTEIMNDQEELDLLQNIQDVASGKPVQYIAGHAWFYGLKFKVNPSVLIPRPETEELVHWIITDHERKDGVIKVLDIGTGSGCIPVTLKNHFKSNAIIKAIDISAEALQVAMENAMLHEVQIDFELADFLNIDVRKLGQFDIVVSNPPYIDKKNIDEVLLTELVHEPPQALYPQGDDPDIFYKRICDHLELLLVKDGVCYLEINEFRAHEVINLFRAKGITDVDLRNDMQGRARMLRIKNS